MVSGIESDLEERWRYVYPPNNSTNETAKGDLNDSNDSNGVVVKDSPRRTRYSLRGTVSLTPVAVVRLVDQQEFRIGDCVAVDAASSEPFIGVIHSFSLSLKGRMTVKTVWFVRPNDIAKNKRIKHLYNELYISKDSGVNELDVLLSRIKVGDTVEAGKSEYNYVCSTAFDMLSSKYSGQFIWTDLYKGRDTDMVKFQNEIVELFHNSDKGPRTPSKLGSKTLSRPSIASHDEDSRPQDNYASDYSDSDEDYHIPDNANDTKDTDGLNKRTIDSLTGTNGKSPKSDRKKKASQTSTPKKDSLTPKKQKASQTPKKQKSSQTPTKTLKHIITTPSKRFVVKRPLDNPSLPRLELTHPEMGIHAEEPSTPISPYQQARNILHVASVPDSLPCRENEFSQIFLSVESAVSSATGSCIYVSGTPGTGKTATIREVISQLQLRVEDGELAKFHFVEINGMQLTNPHFAYEILWQEISGQRVTASNAMSLLERQFRQQDNSSPPV